MKTERRRTIRISILVLILLLGIGFAALKTTLKIDGIVNLSKTTWDVHFENVNVTQGSVEASPAPTTNNTDTTEMTYTINFTKPGDFYEFTVDIVNNGTIDAMIELVTNNAYANAQSTTPITLPGYLTSTITYEDGTPIIQNQKLEHSTSEKIKVRVEFKKDISASDLPSSGDTTVVFKFIGKFKQEDEYAKNIDDWILPQGKTKDNLTFGDEICTRDQCFNFIKYEGTDNDIVMLAKYNLKVGDITKSLTKVGEYTSSNPGYGLQSSEVRGCHPATENCNGTVGFSGTNYWWSGESFNPDYGTTAPFDVYDSSYDTAPDFSNTCNNMNNCWFTPGYSVAYYVEMYKSKLTTDFHRTIKEARILTYDELEDPNIGCSGYYYNCSKTTFIQNTSFWVGSIWSNNNVWVIDSHGGFNVKYYARNWDYGVRPVIVVSKSNM